MSDPYAGAFDEIVDDPGAEPRVGDNGGSKGAPIRFKLTPFEQIQISTAPDYVVKGIIPKGGLVVIWGAPKCGKSFLAFDMAVHIALGREYRGRRVQGGPVIYLALEGGRGFAKRVEAWRKHHGYRGSAPFYLLNVPIDLIGDHAALIADIRAQCANPTAVYLDTLNRALGTLDENSSADMGKLIKAVDAIRAAFGCAVVIIHHCGVAGSRPRGHTSLSGADDVQIAVVKDKDGLITVMIEHMKDGEPASPFACRLEPVELGVDDDGDPMNSCAIEPADLTSASTGTGASKLTGSQARFLDILTGAVLDAPAEHKTASGIPGGRTTPSAGSGSKCVVSQRDGSTPRRPRTTTAPRLATWSTRSPASA
jgi:hypothetical protein